MTDLDRQLADEIKRLRVENARLRQALRNIEEWREHDRENLSEVLRWIEWMCLEALEPTPDER
jgi:septal ring factor EnvC (AmiA/AmiB activator)